MVKSFTARQHSGACIPLDRALLKQIAAPAPYRLLFQTCIEWLWILVLIAAAVWFSNTAVTIVCITLIATRQHALLVLMHEYSHYQFSRKRPLLNDLVGDVLTAFPFLITIHGFRRNHMPHHRYASTDDDPDWIASMKKDRYRFPKTRKQVCLEIVKHCAGWYTFSDLKGYTIDSGMAIDLPRFTRISRAVFLTGFVVATSWFGWWWNVFLYWIVPLATVLMAILYLRDMGEHFGMPSPGIAGSRTVLAGAIERLLICQNGVNFHTEHHLFPSVPFFRLHRLHRALMQDSRYRHHAVLTRGYLSGLIDEVATVPSNTWRADEATMANGSLRS